MDKHKVVHFKEQCISCGACAAISPEFWEMEEGGLAHMKGSKQTPDHWELDLSTEEARAANQEAADCCPVNIIHVKKIDKEDEKK